MFSKNTVIFEKFFIGLVFSCLAASCLAQNTLQGVVLDGETNEPLPRASVFLANTTHGVATNLDGTFIISGGLARVHYKLVISFVGYHTQVIDVVPGEAKTYKILLQPAPKTLNEVVISSRKSSRSEWLANFRIFKERFIGLSENARYCTFENASLLHFRKNDGVLHATADSILILENRGLGYRIKILLEKYNYNIVRYLVHYEGQVVYEALTPQNNEEAKRWAKSRLKAYYGSEMHFLRAFYKRNLNDEGYYFNLIDPGTRHGVADTLKTPRTPIFNDRRIKISTINNYNRVIDSLSSPQSPLLKFDGELEVQYIMEAESNAYQVNRSLRSEKKPQLSQMILLKPAVIQPHGQLYPQDAIETRGYWSWELMAESLPLDYQPVEDEKLVSEVDQ